ncbi:MAG: glycosyltransferase family 4 protein [Candidatus Kaiserbacteria bacterium]|nr:glycosyltransferase family 4 protein [Candidatus Kaiserbacteria bacterium]
MKRILIFSLAYYPHVGGAEIALKEITDRISAEEIEFHMVTMNFGGEALEEKIGNVFVHRVGPPAGGHASYFQKILFIPRAAATAARLHRTHHFTAFWAMMSYMLFPIVLLRFMGLRNPYLLTLQEGDPWQHMFGRWFILPFRPLLSAGFKNASAVQTISTYLATWARRMGYQGEISVIPNGVDVERFKSVQHVQHRVLDTSGIVKLVTTSRLVHKNAIDDVIHALKLLPDNIRFVIYGIGPDEEMLKTLAKNLGVEQRVKFMGHIIDHSELLHALGECDIFIRPSRSEGMGNSFIEAMAAGLPVIATQEGGIADFLFDAKRNPDKETTGWAVDKDSSEQIAKAVKEILNNPEQTKQVVSNAKKLVTENYDWDLIAGKIRTLFGDIFPSI